MKTPKTIKYELYVKLRHQYELLLATWTTWYSSAKENVNFGHQYDSVLVDAPQGSLDPVVGARTVELSDDVRQETPVGFMVFAYEGIDVDYMVFLSEREALDYALDQEERACFADNSWPIYALWASKWPNDPRSPTAERLRMKETENTPPGSLRRVVRRIPIDFKALAHETGIKRGKICKSSWLGWCVESDDGTNTMASITPPAMLDGEIDITIQNRQWCYHAPNAHAAVSHCRRHQATTTKEA